MSSSAAQYFQNSQYYQQLPQYGQTYIPMVNVPTSNRIPTHGELATSIDLLIAHIKQFSTRLDRIESRVNDWVNLSLAERMNITEKNINTIKTSYDNKELKIGYINDDINYIHDLIRDTNERLRDNEIALDKLEDITSKNKSMLKHTKKRSKDLAKKYAEVAILRRRVSKIEDFNTEFIECFETPSQLRGIITETDNQINECDRTITNIVRYGCGACSHTNNNEECNYLINDNYAEDYKIESWKNVEEYFANYYDDNDDDNENNKKSVNNDSLFNINSEKNIHKKGQIEKEQQVEEDEFEKL